MAAYAHDNTYFSRRLVVLFIAAALHVFLAYALITGLARKMVEVLAAPIETDIIEELEASDEPPPPPPPELDRPPVEVPPPEVSIDIPIETTTTTAISAVVEKPKPVVQAPPRQVVKVKARIDPKRFPSTDDYYPASAKRLGQEGSPVVRACVGPDGKLTEPPSIAQSSGTPALDEGAIKVARAGRYIAGTEDGKPVTECLNFKITFQLKD